MSDESRGRRPSGVIEPVHHSISLDLQQPSAAAPAVVKKAKELGSVKQALTAAKALRKYMPQGRITDYEEREIFDHREIWFVGKAGISKVKGSIVKEANCGYDDSRGDYKEITNDHIVYRYEVLGLLGQGSFGKVHRCLDHKTGKEVAIKIIRNKKKFHHQAAIEVKVLEHLKRNDEDAENNVI